MNTLPRPDRIDDCVLVTHLGCMDGSGVAIIFLAAGGKRENVVFVAAGGVERFIRESPLMLQDKFIIFADVGLNPGSARYADELEKRGNCVLLDHHVTSSYLVDRHWCKISNEACGTEMLRRYLVENGFLDGDNTALKNFAITIDDHDRFQQKIPHAEKLGELAVFYGQDEFINRFSNPWRFEHFQKSAIPPFSDFDIELCKILDSNALRGAERAAKNLIVHVINYFDTPVKIGYILSGNLNTTKVLMEVLRLRPDVDIVAQIMLDAGKVSMRSRNDGPDVSKLAMEFRGGGHVHAAGHHISQETINHLIEEIHPL